MTRVEQPAVGGLRFEVLAEVAVGATARVDLCRTVAPINGQLIAVKRLLPELAGDPSSANRFLDEVWMTSALRHPNVVGVMGWGHDDRGAYLAVELVQGVSLERLVKTVVDTREEFPERLVVYICSSIAKGLVAAHELQSNRGEPLGVVHRDLGPSNVLVGFNGDVKIADFGLATAKNRLTQTTSSLPTRSVGHLSPEDLRGEDIDARADIYGLGIILFELITGRPAFTGTDELDTSRNVLSGNIPDPLRYRPKMDRTLAELMSRCMDKDRARRPASAREISQVLDGWLFSHGYRDDNVEALARFVRRNAMRQMRWFERVIAGGDSQSASEPQSAPAPPRPAPPKVAQPSRDSIPTKETETTVVERNKKPSSAPRRAAVEKPRREMLRTMRDPESIDRPGIPRLNQDDEEEEGENIPTVAVKRPVLPPAPAVRAPTPPVPERTGSAAAINAPVPQIRSGSLSGEEITSDSIDLIEDLSTDDRARTHKDLKGPAGALTNAANPIASSDASGASGAGVATGPEAAKVAPPVAPSRPPPPPVQAKPAPGPVPPRIISRDTSSSIESATMTLPNQLLAPEYIKHQVERLRGIAQRKVTEARQAREEAEAARLEAEGAEEDAREAEKAVAMALEALQMAKDNQTSRAAEKLEEALSLVDGPPGPLGS